MGTIGKMGMLKKRTIWRALTLLIAVLVVLPGCGQLNPIIPQKAPDKVVEAKYKDVPIEKAYRDANNLLTKAQNEALHFLSPNNYRAARSALLRARAGIRDPEKKADVFQSLYKLENALNNGFEVKAIVEREMPEIINMRITLEGLNAKRVFPGEYRSRTTSMLMLIERIENHKENLFSDSDKKADFVKDKNNMLADLQKFQLRVVKATYLEKGESVFAEAERYDAKNNAPKTYSQTIKARDDAITYIEKNLQDVEGIKAVSDAFTFAAFHLLHVTRSVGAILQIEKNQHEDYVLKNESRFAKISKALKLGNLRDKSIDGQATVLVTTVNKLMRQKEEYALKIAELSSATTTSTTTITTSTQATSTENRVAANPAPAVKDEANQIPITKEALSEIINKPPKAAPPQQNNEATLKKQVETLTLQNKTLTEQRLALEKQVSGLQAKLNAKPFVKQSTTPAPANQQGKPSQSTSNAGAANNKALPKPNSANPQTQTTP